MKLSRADVHRKAFGLPVLRFEDQTLTSFAGLIIFQPLFSCVKLKERLRSCFRHLTGGSIYGLPRVVLQIIVHLLLGFRKLSDVRRKLSSRLRHSGAQFSDSPPASTCLLVVG